MKSFTNFKIQSIFVSIFLVGVIFGLESCASTDGAGDFAVVGTDGSKVYTKKRVYKPGETIKVYWKNFPGNRSDWITIVRSTASTRSYKQWTYLYGKRRGSKKFNGLPNGTYEVRAYHNWPRGSYKVVARYRFSVKGKYTITKGKLSLSKKTFHPGEKITVTFKASYNYKRNAWVGIIPSRIPHGSEARNDRYDITYQYLNKRISGKLTFYAPYRNGNFDFRMHDTDYNGREVASVSFTVSGTAQFIKGKLSLKKTVYRPGERIVVRFNASRGYASNAWVGIIPSRIPHGSEARNDRYDMTYQYLRKRTKGVLIFHAPYKSGDYDFRMHNTDSNGVEVAHVSFTVDPKASKTKIVEKIIKKKVVIFRGVVRQVFGKRITIASINTAPATNGRSITFLNRWGRQSGRGVVNNNFHTQVKVNLLRGRIRKGDTAVIYKTVFVKQKKKIKIKGDGDFNAKISTDKTSYTTNDPIVVSWQGFTGASSDWITVVRSTAPHTTYSQWTYLRSKPSGTHTFRPVAPGTYEVRGYFNWPTGGYNVMAKKRFTVKVGKDYYNASLKINKKVFSPGETIRVTFKASSGYSTSAWVGIIPSRIPHGSESRNDSYDITYQYLRKRTQGTLIFRAPRKSGKWDFRMHDTDANGKEVASVSFVVE